MNNNTNSRNPLTWLPLILAATFLAGMWTGGSFFGSDSPRSRAYNKLNDILHIVEGEYVDKIDVDSLLEQSIPDILAHLDPHSTYIPASDLQAVNDELGGSFSGIGVSFSLINDTITVLDVISGGPSEKVGLLPGDRIVSINDSLSTGKAWNNEKVMTTLRGKKGSKVKLGIKRATAKDVLTFTVTRGDIPVTSIDAAYLANPTTGYIRVNKFGANTYSEFLQALVSLREKGAKGYVIDLRENGGGFMEPAILMANEFLDEGRLIVSTRGRLMQNNSDTYADGTGGFKDAAVAVLIDEFSASASEIFAGAIQDNDRGMIVGRRSFGKGLVQNQTMLPDSSAIRLTVARYYTPSGRCIQKRYSDGDINAYNNDIVERINHGELYSADSIKLDKSLIFKTVGGRSVYGGGGIMPDIFVANDTSGVTSYYLNVANAGLLNRFAFEYADRHRSELRGSKDVHDLVGRLPDEDFLLQEFVNFAADNNIPARWYYINISRNLIVNQLRALIARDILNQSAYFEYINRSDVALKSAIEQLKKNPFKSASK